MENTKNNNILFSVIFVLVGFIFGWLVFGQTYNKTVSMNSHAMPDGTMMADSMGGMMAGLTGKTGDQFDKAFLSEMIMHHEGAVLMAQSALENAQHQELKDMAKAIISAQTDEINQMKNWQKTWYGTQN